MEFRKWIGREVEMIYEDAKGSLSRRLVRVEGFSGKHLKAFDLAKRQPRTFRTDGILALMPPAAQSEQGVHGSPPFASISASPRGRPSRGFSF